MSQTSKPRGALLSTPGATVPPQTTPLQEVPLQKPPNVTSSVQPPPKKTLLNIPTQSQNELPTFNNDATDNLPKNTPSSEQKDSSENIMPPSILKRTLLPPPSLNNTASAPPAIKGSLLPTPQMLNHKGDSELPSFNQKFTGPPPIDLGNWIPTGPPPSISSQPFNLNPPPNMFSMPPPNFPQLNMMEPPPPLTFETDISASKSETVSDGTPMLPPPTMFSTVPLDTSIAPPNLPLPQVISEPLPNFQHPVGNLPIPVDWTKPPPGHSEMNQYVVNLPPITEPISTNVQIPDGLQQTQLDLLKVTPVVASSPDKLISETSTSSKEIVVETKDPEALLPHPKMLNFNPLVPPPDFSQPPPMSSMPSTESSSSVLPAPMQQTNMWNMPPPGFEPTAVSESSVDNQAANPEISSSYMAELTQWYNQIEDYEKQMLTYFDKCASKLREWHKNGGEETTEYRLEYTKLTGEYDKFVEYMKTLKEYYNQQLTSFNAQPILEQQVKLESPKVDTLPDESVKVATPDDKLSIPETEPCESNTSVPEPEIQIISSLPTVESKQHEPKEIHESVSLPPEPIASHQSPQFAHLPTETINSSQPPPPPPPIEPQPAAPPPEHPVVSSAEPVISDEAATKYYADYYKQMIEYFSGLLQTTVGGQGGADMSGMASMMAQAQAAAQYQVPTAQHHVPAKQQEADPSSSEGSGDENKPKLNRNQRKKKRKVAAAQSKAKAKKGGKDETAPKPTEPPPAYPPMMAMPPVIAPVAAPPLFDPSRPPPGYKPYMDPPEMMQACLEQMGSSGQWDWTNWNVYMSGIAQTHPQWYSVFQDFSHSMGFDWAQLSRQGSTCVNLSYPEMPPTSMMGPAGVMMPAQPAVTGYSNLDNNRETIFKNTSNENTPSKPKAPSTKPSNVTIPASATASAAPVEEDDSDDEPVDPKAPRWCKDCRQEFSNHHTYTLHLRGLKHMHNALERATEKNPAQFQEEAEKQRKAAQDDLAKEGKHLEWVMDQYKSEKRKGLGLSGSFYCTLCNVECTSEKALEFHVNGQKHTRNIEQVMQRGNKALTDRRQGKQRVAVRIQSVLDSCLEALVGLNYVIEYQREDALIPCRYYCELCDHRFGPHNLIVHVTGIKHRKNYMKYNYFDMYEILDQDSSPKQVKVKRLDVFARKVEEYEGRKRLSVRMEITNPELKEQKRKEAEKRRKAKEAEEELRLDQIRADVLKARRQRQAKRKAEKRVQREHAAAKEAKRREHERRRAAEMARIYGDEVEEGEIMSDEDSEEEKKAKAKASKKKKKDHDRKKTEKTPAKRRKGRGIGQSDSEDEGGGFENDEDGELSSKDSSSGSNTSDSSSDDGEEIDLETEVRQEDARRREAKEAETKAQKKDKAEEEEDEEDVNDLEMAEFEEVSAGERRALSIQLKEDPDRDDFIRRLKEKRMLKLRSVDESAMANFQLEAAWVLDRCKREEAARKAKADAEREQKKAQAERERRQRQEEEEARLNAAKKSTKRGKDSALLLPQLSGDVGPSRDLDGPVGPNASSYAPSQPKGGGMMQQSRPKGLLKPPIMNQPMSSDMMNQPTMGGGMMNQPMANKLMEQPMELGKMQQPQSKTLLKDPINKNKGLLNTPILNQPDISNDKSRNKPLLGQPMEDQASQQMFQNFPNQQQPQNQAIFHEAPTDMMENTESSNPSVISRSWKPALDFARSNRNKQPTGPLEEPHQKSQRATLLPNPTSLISSSNQPELPRPALLSTPQNPLPVVDTKEIDKPIGAPTKKLSTFGLFENPNQLLNPNDTPPKPLLKRRATSPASKPNNDLKKRQIGSSSEGLLPIPGPMGDISLTQVPPNIPDIQSHGLLPVPHSIRDSMPQEQQPRPPIPNVGGLLPTPSILPHPSGPSVNAPKGSRPLLPIPTAVCGKNNHNQVNESNVHPFTSKTNTPHYSFTDQHKKEQTANFKGDKCSAKNAEEYLNPFIRAKTNKTKEPSSSEPTLKPQSNQVIANPYARRQKIKPIPPNESQTSSVVNSILPDPVIRTEIPSYSGKGSMHQHESHLPVDPNSLNRLTPPIISEHRNDPDFYGHQVERPQFEEDNRFDDDYDYNQFTDPAAFDYDLSSRYNIQYPSQDKFKGDRRELRHDDEDAYYHRQGEQQMALGEEEEWQPSGNDKVVMESSADQDYRMFQRPSRVDDICADINVNELKNILGTVNKLNSKQRRVEEWEPEPRHSQPDRYRGRDRHRYPERDRDNERHRDYQPYQRSRHDNRSSGSNRSGRTRYNNR